MTPRSPIQSAWLDLFDTWWTLHCQADLSLDEVLGLAEKIPNLRLSDTSQRGKRHSLAVRLMACAELPIAGWNLTLAPGRKSHNHFVLTKIDT